MRFVEGGAQGGFWFGRATSNHRRDTDVPRKPIAPAATAAKRPPVPSGTATTVPLTPIQRAMFKNMTKSLAIPHFLYSDEIVMDATSSIRSSINSSLNDSSPVDKISYLPLVAKAVALAARSYPSVNASLTGDIADVSSIKLVQHPHVNLSFALDTPQGLQMPVIHAVDTLSTLEIAAEMERLRGLGMQGKLGRQDIEGGTITLSNIGNVGGGVVMPVSWYSLSPRSKLSRLTLLVVSGHSSAKRAYHRPRSNETSTPLRLADIRHDRTNKRHDHVYVGRPPGPRRCDCGQIRGRGQELAGRAWANGCVDEVIGPSRPRFLMCKRLLESYSVSSIDAGPRLKFLDSSSLRTRSAGRRMNSLLVAYFIHISQCSGLQLPRRALSSR